MTPVQILVGTSTDTVYIEAQGRATHQEAHPLQGFAQEMIERGFRQFELDCRRCSAMDSTFLGTLAGIGMRLMNEPGGSLTLFHVSPVNLQTIKTLGIDRFLRIDRTLSPFVPRKPPRLRLLPREAFSKEWESTVLNAHTLLADIGAQGGAVWDDVVRLMQIEVEPTDPVDPPGERSEATPKKVDPQ
jgi:anti-anti-sigma factor